jgi:glycosyltransferase involved in cell wall biosynthesis
MILCVGYIIRRKGQLLVTEALGRLRQEEGMKDLFGVFVGGPGDEPGVMKKVLRLRDRYGLGPFLYLPGEVEHDELVHWYNAADVMCLASDKEGRANVLLESLACGTPVVGTDVWGTPEVISSPSMGILVERTVDDIERGLREALTKDWDREVMAAYAREHSWERAAERVVEEFERAWVVHREAQRNRIVSM